MNARRFSVAALAVSCALVGVLALASVPASAALKATFVRQLTGASTPAKSFFGLSEKSVAVDDFPGFVGETFVAETYGSGASVQVFDSSGKYLTTWSGGNTPQGRFGNQLAVAVNNATGDVYVIDNDHNVVDVFESSGKYLATWTGANTPAKSFGTNDSMQGGLVVDETTGDVYVSDIEHNVVDIFDAAGNYLTQLTGFPHHGGAGFSTAVDEANGNVFVGESQNSLGPPAIYEFDSSGNIIAMFEGENTPAKKWKGAMDLAYNKATGNLLVADPATDPSEKGLHDVVDVFDSSFNYLTPQLTGVGTPRGSFQGPYGVSVDQATGDIYVSNEGQEEVEENGKVVVRSVHAVEVFSTVVVPDVLEGEPSGVQPTGVTLNGFVNPDGIKAKECMFEYGTSVSYGESRACVQEPIGEGNKLVPVSANLSGLQPDTLYHFRLDAGNANGLNSGVDSTFFTSTAPLVEGESSSNVGSATATAGAQLDAAGLSTTYRVEYGLSTAYGSSTAEASLGNAESYTGTLVHLEDLLANSEYHYRFVATNAFGTTYGGDATFKTLLSPGAASGSGLPDGRVYELVSPPSLEDSQVYFPAEEEEVEHGGLTNLYAKFSVQASESGDAVVYSGDASPSGSGSSGKGFGNQYLASRGSPGGWSARVITPTASPLEQGIYTGFTNDLSTGFLYTGPEALLTADAPPECGVLYSRTINDGSYHALFTKGPRNPGESCSVKRGENIYPEFAGVSADGSHVVFSVESALTAEAPGYEERDLYETVNGRLYLVNVLPEGKPEANAKFGPAANKLLSRVISTDGSRVFWTDLNNHNVYVRENMGTAQARTVQVDGSVGGGGEYWSATADGSLAFFTKEGSLYSFDVNSEQTTNLAPAGEVLGVVGASEDGSYVYFVANASLATGASTGQPNLYVYHGGTTQFIATLTAGDYNDWSTTEKWKGHPPGDIVHTANVTPDGQGVVFMSSSSLTSYNSNGANEVYVYGTASGKVRCASCASNGAPPVAGGARLSRPTENTRLPRWISADGDRVFFDTAEPLVAQDTNGLNDVYEWEREGSGGCEQAGGCVYLLSGGQSGPSLFVEASVTGDNVFFATAEQLAPEDSNDVVDLYDARVNGYRPLSPPACSGTGCQGLPGAQPIFATPSSVTFSGVGNFEAPPSTTVKPKSKTLKCKKGAIKRKGRCVKAKKGVREKTRKASRSSKGRINR